MSFSFFTIPAENPPGQAKRGEPTRGRVIVTWGLMGVYLILISFSVVAMINPDWLQRISSPGMETEFNDCKNFGDDLYRQGKYQYAIAQYQHALGIIPDDVSVLINLGTAWIKTGYRKHGLEVLLAALEKVESKLSRGIICTNLAEIYGEQKQVDEAIRYMLMAVECGTELNLRYGKLGTLYLAKDELAKAEEAFEQSLAQQMNICRTYREMLYRAQDSFAGEEDRTAIIAELLSRPCSAEDLARFDLETIRALQESNRTVAITHNYLGWIDIRYNRFDEAELHFEESLRIWPDARNRNAHKNLALIHQMKAKQP